MNSCLIIPKSKGTLPVINWSAGFKDSLQDQTENDISISHEETIGHERDELEETDLESENIWLRFWCKLTAYCHSLMEI